MHHFFKIFACGRLFHFFSFLKNFKNGLENIEKNLKIIPKIAAIPVQREIQR